jgi:DNA polymerase-3 subunit gamma/tau
VQALSNALQQPPAPRLPVHRHARHRQDHGQPHPGQEPELHRARRQGGITAEPCGVCQACTEIDADRYIDYIELDAASNRSIDEIRDLIERAAYKPGVGRFKVFMIDEAHQLTKDAFNALLKTLEEPPDYLKFVLATTDPEKMLPTVLSRCLQFNLRPMAPDGARHLQQVLRPRACPSTTARCAAGARRARVDARRAVAHRPGHRLRRRPARRGRGARHARQRGPQPCAPAWCRRWPRATARPCWQRWTGCAAWACRPPARWKNGHAAAADGRGAGRARCAGRRPDTEDARAWRHAGRPTKPSCSTAWCCTAAASWPDERRIRGADHGAAALPGLSRPRREGSARVRPRCRASRARPRCARRRRRPWRRVPCRRRRAVAVRFRPCSRRHLRAACLRKCPAAPARRPRVPAPSRPAPSPRAWQLRRRFCKPPAPLRHRRGTPASPEATTAGTIAGAPPVRTRQHRRAGARAGLQAGLQRIDDSRTPPVWHLRVEREPLRTPAWPTSWPRAGRRPSATPVQLQWSSRRARRFPGAPRRRRAPAPPGARPKSHPQRPGGARTAEPVQDARIVPGSIKPV